MANQFVVEKKWFAALGKGTCKSGSSGDKGVVRTTERTAAHTKMLQGFILLNWTNGIRELDRELLVGIKKIYKDYKDIIDNSKFYGGGYSTEIFFFDMVFQILRGNAFYIVSKKGHPTIIDLKKFCELFGCSRELFYRYPYNDTIYYDDSTNRSKNKIAIFKEIEEKILKL